MINICFICSEYPPALTGGIGVFTKTLAENLSKKGHQVTVVGIYKNIEQSILEEVINGVKVIRVNQPNRKFGWLMARIKVLKILRKLISNNNVEIIEDTDWDLLTAFGKLNNVPIVLRLHNAQLGILEHKKELGKLRVILTQNVIKKALKIVGVSKLTSDSFKRLFDVENNCGFIYNGVNITNQHADFSKRVKNDVIFAGSLVQKKGVIKLVEAWNMVVKILPSAKLHVLGKDGRYDDISMKTHLQKILGKNKDSVIFHGHKNSNEVYDFFSKSYLAIFPSFIEAFSLVPLEAMANGCPTIFTKLTSGPEAIEDGVDGLLVDPYNVNEITDAIIRVLSDDELAEKLSVNGYNRVNRDFNIQQTVEENESFYLKCINEYNKN